MQPTANQLSLLTRTARGIIQLAEASKGYSAKYVLAYARALLDQPETTAGTTQAAKAQCLYIRANMFGLRGPEAKALRDNLDFLIRTLGK